MGIKKYIIFTGTISDMGGGQMYVYNKQKYVESIGYTPYIFTNRGNNIIINGFHLDKVFRYNCLSIFPFLFSEKKQQKIIKSLMADIGYNEGDEIIVESNTPIISLWGELFTSMTKGKHLAFMIDEHYNINSNWIDFFNFKFKRGELAGNKDSTISRIFSGFKDIENSSDYRLSPLCNNVVQNIDNKIVDKIDTNRLVIGSIGRLDKSYVPSMIKELKIFANNHKNLLIQYVFIGGADKKTEKKVRNSFKSFKNVNLLVTGFIYPIPEKILGKINIFISVAGSATLSWLYNIPTISLDVNDYEPIGVLGYTTKATIYRDKKREFSTSQLLDKIFFENYLSNLVYEKKEKIEVNQNYFDHHFDFLNRSNNCQEYYNLNLIKLSSRDNFIKRILCVVPLDIYIFIRDTIRKIKSMI